MERRAFFAGAAATLVAALLTARHPALAQDTKKRRIAIVNATRPVEELTATGHPMYVAFHEELALRGYVEGETVEIERWSGRDWTDWDALARAVVASAPDLIYAASGPAIGPGDPDTRTALVVGRLRGSVPAPESLLSCRPDPARSRCATA